MSITPKFQELLNENDKSQAAYSGQERLDGLSRAVGFVKQRDCIHQGPDVEGRIKVNRVQATERGIKAWHQTFNHVGITDDNIVEMQLTGLPEDLQEFEGQCAISADGVTEDQYRQIVASGVDYTSEEAQKASSIERQVLRKLRSAYETLQEAQSLLDGHADLLERTSSYLTCEDVLVNISEHDFERDRSLLEKAMARLGYFGGMLYAKMNTPFPEPLEGHDELTDEQMDEYMEREWEYAELWVDEGTPPHISNECQEKRGDVAEAEAIAANEQK